MTNRSDIERPVARQQITAGGLANLRARVLTAAEDVGMDADRAQNFALAIGEAATNTIRYAHQSGEITIVKDDHARLYAEVRDHGPGLPPRVNPAVRPPTDAPGGRGLWLIRQLCDRVDIRSDQRGTQVRLEMFLDRS